MYNKNVIIHAGFGKTATSFFQRLVFPYIENTYQSGVFSKDKTRLKDLSFFLFSSCTDFSFQKDLDSILGRIKQYNILFSDESLIRFNNEDYLKNINACKQLKSYFPEAKLFICIRKQDDWIKSAYNHTVIKMNKYARFISFEEFIGYKNGKFEESGCFNINNLNWHKLLTMYTEYFGKDNILILPYELFKSSPQEFMEKFYEFTRLKAYYPKEYKFVNKSIDSIVRHPILLKKYTGFIDRIPNNYLKNYLKSKSGFIIKILRKYKVEYDYSNQKLTPELSNLIMEKQRANNILLSELIGHDLSKYGYY